MFALLVVIGLAMAFTFTNGFHDSANAIATSVSTRALTLRAALAMAAVGNLVGSFFGAKVASTVGSGIIDLKEGPDALMLVGCALVGAITWNLITWWFGLPSSSSHALIGGMVGAALVAGVTVLWAGVVEKILLPMVLSPLAGFVLGAAAMLAIMWLFRNASPAITGRRFRHAQTVSAAMMAFGHGMQDAAKTMGIVVLALVVAGYQDDYSIPLWCFLLTAVVLAVGTATGGMRIMRTLGRKIIELDPPQGFAAEATAASVLYVASAGLGAPISTTHVISSAIMGVGSTKRTSAVRWGTAGNMAAAWVTTFPAAAAFAAATFLLAKMVF
ncbi:low-affinity inorganic phosphate transporter [Gordonia namibiensis NBRC 108229]|uniref:Low-affinity inorganic phosphate transporter n=1 Tax=Gordonia namibiensis NBRC 108229 TaxID=1208314 RepID=K6X4W1_9ACTN|nr:MULTISPECIES: inorganic phosphate transporter [Gordonia]GAC01132.1 low-affinity inorganic phosphate transporter [Gordonia namibiensis NBRC 108229]